MFSQCIAYSYAPRYPNLVPDRRRLPPKEMLWRLAWPFVFTLVLASLMLLFIVAIFILEIASLATDRSNNLSNTASTGAGIWCSVFFLLPVIFMFLLVLVYNKSRTWSTYTLITHIIALVFMFVLIGLDANAVTPYNSLITTAPVKIQLLKGQLALAILMILFPIGFIAAYIYTAFKSLYPFRVDANSVHPSYPVPSPFVKY